MLVGNSGSVRKSLQSMADWIEISPKLGEASLRTPGAPPGTAGLLAAEKFPRRGTPPASDGPSDTADDVRRQFFDDHHAKPPTFRMQIFNVLEGLEYSPRSGLYTLCLLITILLSVISFLVSSSPQYETQRPAVFFYVDLLTSVFFTVEWIFRLLTAPVWYKWICEPFTVLDFLSFVPFYVSLRFPAFRAELGTFRILRILPIVARLSPMSPTLWAVGQTMQRSRDGLLLLTFTVILLMVTFSSLLFFAEKTGETFDPQSGQWLRSDGTPSPFQSITHTFWWSVTTISTVGYGDHFPVTTLGKFVGGLTMLCGLLLTAFPVAIFGSNYSQVWAESRRNQSRIKPSEASTGILKTWDQLFELQEQKRRIDAQIDELLHQLQNDSCAAVERSSQPWQMPSTGAVLLSFTVCLFIGSIFWLLIVFSAKPDCATGMPHS